MIQLFKRVHNINSKIIEKRHFKTETVDNLKPRNPEL